MKTLQHYRWTDNSIDISDFYDSLPNIVKNIIIKLEKADEEEDWSYTNLCDSLENVSKLYVPSGRITNEQFNKLCLRYYGG